MGKIVKFWALLLVVAVAVQHIQIERVKNVERERWRQLCIEMDAKRADAAAPVAVAWKLAAIMGPHFLTALVIGTVAYWCWTHNGKESLLQMVKATKDGVEITKDWVQRQIAELHGIDTAPGARVYTLEDAQSGALPSIGDYIHYGTRTYEITSLDMTLCCVGGISLDVSDWGNGNYKFSVYLGFDFDNEGKVWVYNLKHVSNSLIFPPATFDPADYPELYDGPALLTDCHKVMEKNPDIELWVLPVPERPADVPESSVTTIPLAAKLSDGSLVDTDGRKWMAPFPPPPTLGLPTLEDGKVASVSVAQPKDNMPYPPVVLPGDVIIPKPVADELGHYVPVGAKIKGLTNIGGNVANPALEWINAEGKTIVTPIPLDLAANLAGSIPASKSSASTTTVSSTNSTTKTIIHPNRPEEDPGNPEDIALPDVPIFDPEMDWGEEQDWPWESWISSLPFIDVLKSSSINLSGATSVISCDLSFAGKSRTVSYDFSEWSGLLNSMGLLIYACACWYSLQLALLKRD